MGKISESNFVKEFKKFISQGNVMDLAIGVVIGAAFSAIVTSLVNDIIMPIISLIGGGANFSDLAITIPNFFGGNSSAVIKYGNFIQNVVDFLIIAFSLFLVVRAINKLNDRARSAAKKAEAKLGLASAKEAEKAKEATDSAEKAAKQSEKTNKALISSNAEQTKLLKDILKELKLQKTKK